MNEVQVFSSSEFEEIRTKDDKVQMTSLQIAMVAGKRHKDVLEAIRNMEPAWMKITGRKFPLSEYNDSTGRKLPCYQLNKTECLYIATKFNDEARAKLVIRWKELEKEKMFGGFKIPQSYSEALKLAAIQSEQIDQQQKQLAFQAPKVLFATTIEDSDEYCLVDVLAKVLKQNGIDMGQNRLFKWLHNHKYLCNKGGDKNHPTQRAMNLGLFRIVTHIIEDKNGRVKTKRTTKLTNKGLSYFVNKILSIDRKTKS